MADYTKIKKDWTTKARTYMLVGEAAPPLRQIRTKHTYSNHLLYWDETNKENREMRYAANAKSPFKDEQAEKGIRVEHIYLREGFLFTAREDVLLQQFLAIHPDNGKVFIEMMPDKEAEEEVVDFETRATAYEIVKNLSVEDIAAYMYDEIGDSVFDTSSKELKRDLYIVADNEPEYLISLTEDSTVILKYVARKAVKFNILKLADNDRTVIHGKSDKKLLTVDADETPYTAIAEFFQTDDGLVVKEKVLKSLKEYE